LKSFPFFLLIIFFLSSADSTEIATFKISFVIDNSLEFDKFIDKLDTLRTKIKTYASTVSFAGGTKVVILDEADYLNPQSTQPALRGLIEEFSSNCRFIFTCNFSNRIISPLHSRCSVVEFKISKTDLPKVATEFATRLQGILDTEEVEYNNDVLNSLIGKYLPDWKDSYVVFTKDLKERMQ